MTRASCLAPPLLVLLGTGPRFRGGGGRFLSSLLVAVGLAACGAGSRATALRAEPGRAPARNSIELQALARSEEARFARAVAEEAKTPRVEVEAVSSGILIDRARGLVYLVAPGLVALELSTGAERWRRPEVRGTSFARAGTSLVVLGGVDRRQPVLWFLSLAQAALAPTIQRCSLTLPIPAEADEVTVLPFDRAGVPYAYFLSAARQREGGPPPTDSETRRFEAGRACGVVELSPASCSAEATRVQRFLMDPPRERGSIVETEPTDCRYLSPDLELPAVAASRPPAAAPERTPRLAVVRTEVPGAGCLRRATVRLDATDEKGALRWSHALPEDSSRGGCPGPP